MIFIKWEENNAEKLEKHIVAKFRDAAGKVVEANLPMVEQAYWATMNKDEPLTEGTLAGIKFEEAKRARINFKGNIL